MKLDVVVPTYNRSRLLRAAVESLLRAPVPPGLEVRILVVDNNSPDDTAAVVKELQANASLPIQYVFEPRQGLSSARNAGIEAGTSEIVGFIDDDEQIDAIWYQVLAREFADPDTQFIGGPYLPNWAAPAPAWLPPGYHAVIGAIPPKPRARLDTKFAGNLMGGNCALRRTVFARVGMYSPALGRSSKGLLSDEDSEFFGRVRAAGLIGMYVPDFAIHHYIPRERLTRNYHRRWVYWRAVSQGAHARKIPEVVRHLWGVPRYRFASALRGLLSIPRHYLAKQSKGQAFAQELALWDFLGFVYGRYFVTLAKLYPEASPARHNVTAPETEQPS